MADETIDERTFTEAQVREILKRAVEDPPSHALVLREGTSLTELQSIGEEVGIDPRRIEEAALSLALDGSNVSSLFIGRPTRVGFERRVEGAFAPDDTPEILAVIRRATEVHGEVREIQGSLEWSAQGDSGERHITLSCKDGTTRIQASASLVNAAVLTYLPAGLVGLMASIIGIAGFVKEGSVVGLVMAVVLLPILYPILRAVWNRISKSESEKLRAAVDDVARLLEERQD